MTLRADEPPRWPVRGRASSDAEDASPLPLGVRNENPAGMSLAALLAEDFRTHGSTPRAAGFWALAVHRFGNWRMSAPKIVRPPLTVMYRTAHHAVIALWGMDLPYNVKIGRRVRFDHHGCVHLGAQEIGDDCVFRHSVTIGLSRRTDKSTSPTIGARVEVGPGACIVGNVRVGDDSYVGANTVVAQDVPAGAAVLGVPARLVDLDRVRGPR